MANSLLGNILFVVLCSTAMRITTASDAAVSLPPARWRINDQQGNLCMLMDFNATITQTNPVASFHLPSRTRVTNSICDSNKANFLLEFNTGSGADIALWQLTFNFTNMGRTYQLNRMALEIRVNPGIIVDSGSISTTILEVPIGSYYSCASLVEYLGTREINITTPIFQPFVQQTSDRDLGDEFVCGASPIGSRPSSFLIATAILGVALYFLN